MVRMGVIRVPRGVPKGGAQGQSGEQYDAEEKAANK